MKQFARRLGDWPLWGIIASFIGWEMWCHFVMKNKGEHTLSNRVWFLEGLKKSGLPFQVVVALACATLFTHLVFHLP